LRQQKHEMEEDKDETPPYPPYIIPIQKMILYETRNVCNFVFEIP